MKLTIYNTAVKMESQEQCNRMKSLCIENKLPIWGHEEGFTLFGIADTFAYSKIAKEFLVLYPANLKIEKFITEQEFINLLKQTK
jgi:hypothetical protein